MHDDDSTTVDEMPPIPDGWDDDDWMPPAEDPTGWGTVVDMASVLGLELVEPLKPDGVPTLSELGNARRLISMRGDDLRHCASLPGSGWLIWDGSRWASDQTGEVIRIAKTLPEVLRAEAADMERQAKSSDIEEDRKTALKAKAKAKQIWASKCEAGRTIHSAVGLLTTESTVPVTVSDLDADSWLLGTPGATVDLRTGHSREPERCDLLTRQTGVAFEAAAECPEWEAFLLSIMGGDQTMVDYLQRAVGYSLIGITVEQVLFVCHGSGANGKSTFLETLRQVFGDYARNCPADSFVGRRDGVIPNDLAMLAGARFVTASETAENKPLDEALVKALTGGEPVTARYLNREFFEFDPQFTIWLATNHKPRVKGTDHGIWRRIALVPFSVTISPEQMDRDLGQKLRAEGSGILRWAVEGMIEWQRVGLDPPDVVLQATKDYRGEQDVVAEFLGQRCELDLSATTSASDIYTAFAAWTKEAGEYQRSARWLGGQLKARGLEPVRTKMARLWRGIKLQPGAMKSEPDQGRW